MRTKDRQKKQKINSKTADLNPAISISLNVNESKQLKGRDNQIE